MALVFGIGAVTFLKRRSSGGAASADTSGGSGGSGSFLTDVAKPVKSTLGVVCVPHERMACDVSREAHAHQTRNSIIAAGHAWVFDYNH
jgi:hypothetical protein